MQKSIPFCFGEKIVIITDDHLPHPPLIIFKIMKLNFCLVEFSELSRNIFSHTGQDVEKMIYKCSKGYIICIAYIISINSSESF
jgi:hypothetical protein